MRIKRWDFALCIASTHATFRQGHKRGDKLSSYNHLANACHICIIPEWYQAPMHARCSSIFPWALWQWDGDLPIFVSIDLSSFMQQSWWQTVATPFKKKHPSSWYNERFYSCLTGFLPQSYQKAIVPPKSRTLPLGTSRVLTCTSNSLEARQRQHIFDLLPAEDVWNQHEGVVRDWKRSQYLQSLGSSLIPLHWRALGRWWMNEGERRCLEWQSLRPSRGSSQKPVHQPPYFSGSRGLSSAPEGVHQWVARRGGGAEVERGLLFKGRPRVVEYKWVYSLTLRMAQIQRKMPTKSKPVAGRHRGFRTLSSNDLFLFTVKALSSCSWGLSL